MKQYINIFLAATALTTVSCSDSNFDDILSGGEKEVISFSMSDGTETSGNISRAASQGAFSNPTRIVMYMRSNKNGETSNVVGNKTECQTKAYDNSGTDHSDITFTSDDKKRYWDDAFGRSAHISVYAVAIPGTTDAAKLKSDDLKNANATVAISNTWTTVNDTDPIDMTFAVTKTTQTETTWSSEDLVYSNNIQKTGTDGRTYYDWTTSKWHPESHQGGDGKHGNGCLQFMPKSSDVTGPGYFDRGHMKFYHALSRITVTLKEGEGFNSSSDDDFKFTTTDHNIKLLNMYTSGKLNMKDGTWAKNAATDIDVMVGPTDVAKDKTFKAQMLPDYAFEKDSKDKTVMQFEIDNNIYYISQADLYKALADVSANQVADYGYADDKFTMKQGKCYNFTIMVNKKQIDNITASVLAWDDVTAQNQNMDNSHITFSLSDLTGTKCTEINFLRHAEPLNKIYTDDNYSAEDFSGDYKTEGAATLTGTDKYKTNWFYEDNQTAYHFRTLNHTAYGTDGANLKNTSEPSEDPETYFEMASGADVDYHWGAPFKTDANKKYDITTGNGYKANIYKGIMSNTSDIKIQEFHMMSKIKVILKTKDNGYVNLKDASVTFTQITKNAKVDLGTGYITDVYDDTSDETKSQTITAPSFDSWTDGTKETGEYTWYFVPQPLVRGTSPYADGDYVGITIKTADNNQYYIVKNLSDIIASNVTDGRDQTQSEAIEQWYPGHTYTYTFTLTKKGIEAITATVADWVNVTAGNQDITLEN